MSETPRDALLTVLRACAESPEGLSQGDDEIRRPDSGSIRARTDAPIVPGANFVTPRKTAPPTPAVSDRSLFLARCSLSPTLVCDSARGGDAQ